MVAPPEICPERTVLHTQHRPRSVPAASACACAGEGRPQQHRAYPGCTPHRAPCPTSSSAAAWRPPRRSALPRRRTTSPPRREISHLPTWEKQSAPFTSARFRSGRHTVRPVSTPSLDGHPAPRCGVTQQRTARTNGNTMAPALQVPHLARVRRRGSRPPGAMSSWAASEAPPHMSLPLRGPRDGCGWWAEWAPHPGSARSPPPELRRAPSARHKGPRAAWPGTGGQGAGDERGEA